MGSRPLQQDHAVGLPIDDHICPFEPISHTLGHGRARADMATKLITRADIEALSRRSGMPPMIPSAQPGPNPQQIQAQQAAYQEQLKKREDAKNRSQKPVERNLPDGVDEVVIGDGAQRYKEMRDLERRLDALMMRKRLDVQDSVYRDVKQQGTLRIWISNTVENQPWQYTGMDSNAYDFSSGVEATFRVKIEGRLLEDPEEPTEDETTEQQPANEEGKEAAGEGEPAAKRTKLSPSPPARKKLSHFFKSIAIDFDRPRALQPDGYTRIEWKRPDIPPSGNAEPPKEADFDRLEFERKADENINITISLVRDDYPERYRLAKPLAELLDMEEADRQTVLMGIWEYIKLAGVRMDEDKRQIYCDHRLQAVSPCSIFMHSRRSAKQPYHQVFGHEVLFFPNLRDAIRPHLFDPPPIALNYTIRVDKPFHTTAPQPNYTIYDIPVPLSSPLTNQLKSLTRNPSHISALQQIARTDDDIALIVQKINEGKAKHDFFTSMSKDPARFVQRWISSQKRDLDVVLGAGAWGEEDWQGAEWRKGGNEGVWGSREAVEGVGSYLNRVRS